MSRLTLPAMLAVSVACALLAARGWRSSQPVYTVASIQVGLQGNPSAWLGRPLLVAGIVAPLTFPCTPSLCPQALNDPEPGSAEPYDAGPPLPLLAGASQPLLDALRAVPFAGRMMPHRQRVHWGRPAIYRVSLQDASAAVCGYAHCRVAILLDAAPIGPNDWAIQPQGP